MIENELHENSHGEKNICFWQKELKRMVKDYKGYKYSTVKEMCNHYHISVQTYYYRINHGYSLEQALSYKKEETRNVAKTKFVNCQNPVDEEERIDHLGNIFPSKTHMCKQYGISRSLYHYRRKTLCWSKEDALCVPVERKYLPIEKRTINGITYKNVSQIRRVLFNDEISDRVLCGLLLKYENTEEAVKRAKSIIRNRKRKEIRKKLLEKYNIDEYLYYTRIWRGWSTVRALTEPKRDEQLEEGRTFDGVIYGNIEEMCNAYGINSSTYLQRISRGISKEVALLTPINITKSMKEIEINKFLSDLANSNIIDEYFVGYTFEECRDKAKLPFDFLIVKNNKIGIIEFDGRQHFVPNCFWSLEEAVSRGYKDTNEAAQKEFELIRKHDLLKNEFCEKNKIPLLRIKYSQSCHMEQMIENFVMGLNAYTERFNPYIINEEYYA